MIKRLRINAALVVVGFQIPRPRSSAFDNQAKYINIKNACTRRSIHSIFSNVNSRRMHCERSWKGCETLRVYGYRFIISHRDMRF